jgi:hypothetical protein
VDASGEINTWIGDLLSSSSQVHRPEFSGFFTDDYTTLAETHDREVMATASISRNGGLSRRCMSERMKITAFHRRKRKVRHTAVPRTATDPVAWASAFILEVHSFIAEAQGAEHTTLSHDNKPLDRKLQRGLHHRHRP